MRVEKIPIDSFIRKEEANAFIRITMREHGVEDVPIEWTEQTSNWLGLFCFPHPSDNSLPKIFLSELCRITPNSFRWVFLHELAHLLDYKQKGKSAYWQQRMKHNKEWRAICRRLGIPSTRFINAPWNWKVAEIACKQNGVTFA